MQTNAKLFKVMEGIDFEDHLFFAWAFDEKGKFFKLTGTFFVINRDRVACEKKNLRTGNLGGKQQGVTSDCTGVIDRANWTGKQNIVFKEANYGNKRP